MNPGRFLLLEFPRVSQAVTHQQKAVMSSERLQGTDHPQTIQDYVSLCADPQTEDISMTPSSLFRQMCSVLQTHLALYCFAGGRRSAALQLLYRARYLTLIVSGEDHPQIIALDVSETFDPESKADNVLQGVTFQNDPLLKSLLSSASECAGPRSSRTHGA